MAYRKDEISIRNGDILEITKSKRLPVKNRLRCIKMNTTSEQQEKRNIKYATNLLRLLLLQNFNENDLYCTLTYDKPVAGEEAKKHLANFRKRLQRLAQKLNIDVKYIAVTEIGGKNKIHHHIIIHTSKNIIKVSHIRDIWKNGFVKIKLYGGTLQDAESLANYFIKKNRNALYILPNIYKKRWNSSQNLQKPQRSTAVIHHKIWKIQPKTKKGYYLDTHSIINGFYEFDSGIEYEYQFYRLIRIKPPKSK
jgi:hypothetical protein